MNRRSFAQESSVYSPGLGELSNAGEKKIDETISVTAFATCSSTALARVRFAQRRSFDFALFE